MKHESNGDRNKKLSVKEFLDKITPMEKSWKFHADYMHTKIVCKDFGKKIR